MPTTSFDFSNKSIAVTGAARGVGLEIATLYSRAGAAVFMIDMDVEELAQAADSIGATAIPASVTSTAEVTAALDGIVSKTGRLDAIVNNAGILRDRVVWKLTDEDWESVLAVHLGGTFRMTRAAIVHFRAQGRGRIVNVTSYTGLHGNVGQANYATAKAGIIGFTKTVAKEVGPFGITVNAISPNADTRMIASIPEEKRLALAESIPLRRIAAPSEMAAAVAFLTSDEASYITGVVLPVDGGLAM